MEKSDVYVITGGGGGLGIACARLLGKKGTLLLADIDPDRVKKAATQFRSEGFNVETIVSDISKEKDIETLAKTTASLGRFAGITHTAGLSPRMADWKRIFEVNLIGTARLLETFLPLAGKGTVAVCLASMAAYLQDSNEKVDAIIDQPLDSDFYKKMAELMPSDPEDQSGSAYCFSKRGVIRLCARKALSWGAKEARLNSVSPGMFDTPMGQGDRLLHPHMDAMLEYGIQHRWGRPEEFANVVAFLMSKEASFVHGAELLVDGGVVAALKSG